MLVFNRSDTYTFDGAISGPGQVVQFGTGKTILTAVSTYTGPTFVNAGTLSVNGSIASSPVFVNFGGTLGGNGTVGPTTILPGGTLSPGNSVGTLTVNGNLSFATASLYMVEVQGDYRRPHQRDRDGDTGGNGRGLVSRRTALARSYTILSAAGGRTGTFDSLCPMNLPAFITASLAYTPTDVQLNLGVGHRPDQRASRATSRRSPQRSTTPSTTAAGTLAGLFGLAPSQLPGGAGHALRRRRERNAGNRVRRRRHVHVDHDGSGRVLA